MRVLGLAILLMGVLLVVAAARDRQDKLIEALS